MPDLTNEQREQAREALIRRYSERYPENDTAFLLRLLDAERERADAAEAKVARVEWCNFVSPSSEDGYCACVKPKHPNTEYHACQHGAMR